YSLSSTLISFFLTFSLHDALPISVSPLLVPFGRLVPSRFLPSFLFHPFVDSLALNHYFVPVFQSAVNENESFVQIHATLLREVEVRVLLFVPAFLEHFLLKLHAFLFHQLASTPIQVLLDGPLHIPSCLFESVNRLAFPATFPCLVLM